MARSYRLIRATASVLWSVKWTILTVLGTCLSLGFIGWNLAAFIKSVSPLFMFALYLVICLIFFGLIVRLLGQREQRGHVAIKNSANSILDFFVIFLLFAQVFFLNNVRHLFPNSFVEKTQEFTVINDLNLRNVILQTVVGFSFIIFLSVLRLNKVQFDPFVILLFILLNPFLIFLCLAQNLIYFFIFFEGFALITTILVVISGQHNGVRVPRYEVLVYLIYSLVGTSLMTLGLTLMFILTAGTVAFFDANFTYKLILCSPFSSLRKAAALVFFLVALNIFFKLGVFPFQNWIFPVYNSLNTAVLFYVVLFSKFVVSLVFIIKFYPMFFNIILLWIFFFVGIISMVLGVYFGLATTKIREIIGASSIVNYGIVMLLISYSAPYCAIFYIFSYTITLLNVMLCLLPYKNRNNDELIDNTDLISYRPRVVDKVIQFDYYIIFSIGALMGLPPFLFFQAKIFVLNVFLHFDTYGSCVVAVFFLLTNVLSAVYYLRILYGFIRGSLAALRGELITCYYSGSTFVQTSIKFFLLVFMIFYVPCFDMLNQSKLWTIFFSRPTFIVQ